MERRQLEHFAAVVEGRHFTWAADLLLRSSTSVDLDPTAELVCVH